MKRRTFLKGSLGAALALSSPLLSGCRKATSDGRIHVTYWEKWGGNEAPAMRAVVDQFNASQDRITVDFLSVSQIDRKVTIAIAGGDPPDIAGLWSYNLAALADMDAILPLGEFMAAEGVSREEWLQRYTSGLTPLFRYHGEVFGLPSTPFASALHWNKTMFRQAGLDPEWPPGTVEELDEMARQLTRKDPHTGQLSQLGFLPSEPGYWTWAFGPWFGAPLFNAAGAVNLAHAPGQLAAMRWVRQYTEEFGLDATRRFTSGFSGASTQQSPFLTGKIAMMFQGPWINRSIRLYAPGLDYGVSPWPHVPGTNPAPFVTVDSDAVAICRGSRHPEAAWEFIKFLSSSNPAAETESDLRGMETVCFLQEKPSPLRVWSPYFTNHHPNPYVGKFREFMASPNATTTPVVGIWQEYARELEHATNDVRLLKATPEEALNYAQQRVQRSWVRHQKSMERQAGAAAKV